MEKPATKTVEKRKSPTARRRTSSGGAGFTLVELLVVISIISTLASTVLASLNEARAKARDAARIQAIEEYKKAIMLSYDANDGVYPNPGDAAPHCLGNYTMCGISNSYSISPIVNDKVDDFLSSLPPLDQVTVIYDFMGIPIVQTMKGVTYQCNSVSCTSPTIKWGTEKDTVCRGGTLVSPNYTRYCLFTFN